jgi:hypothetical protein
LPKGAADAERQAGLEPDMGLRPVCVLFAPRVRQEVQRLHQEPEKPLPNRHPALLVPQVADLAAQHGLGQETRHKRTATVEVFTDVAEEDGSPRLRGNAGFSGYSPLKAGRLGGIRRNMPKNPAFPSFQTLHFPVFLLKWKVLLGVVPGT